MHVTRVIRNRPRCVKIEYLIFMQKDKIALGAELQHLNIGGV